MSFLNRIFFNKRSKSHQTPEPKEPVNAAPITPTQEYAKLKQFTQTLNSLLMSDKFLARSDYRRLVEDYAELNNFFQNQKTAKTLGYYCSANGVPGAEVEAFLRNYTDIANLASGANCIRQHNQTFIQRHLESEKILVISFTNKAVGELRDKINKALKIKCQVTTFHSTGYAILRKQDPAGKNIRDGGFLFNIVNNYLKSNILEQPELVDKLILFFGSYFDAPYEGDDLNSFFNYISKADLTTLKGNMSEYTEEIINKRTGNRISIAHEALRSAQEVKIANFLYLNKIDYAEERRLFYVALTRTKNRVYIITPEQHPSQFVTELLRDYPLVTMDGQLNDQSADNLNNIKRCPVCGYPLQLRYKPHIGLKLWICSNEPEICDFMTNDLRGGNMSILKCDKCQDGYLIVKEGKVEPFLGCTNFKADKTGCDGFMTREYYEKNVLNKEH
ncbi:MAG: topoisomerase DNA-binding C4 zinc finger domain-containing protein [Bacteroidales bacterium]|nr:topoisomerase DNA-binding C4 zinc finger domain-containing protein [Bacteroidales bacterium]